MAVLRVSPGLLRAMADAAEAAFPNESCGLILGCAGPTPLAQCLVPSPNLSPEPRTQFEIDPALRLRLQRELRGTGQALLGIHHSHPAGAARPSARDLAGAWEPGLLWLITAVIDGQAVQTAAFRLGRQADRFEELVLCDDRAGPDPVRATPAWARMEPTNGT
ncbi:M67 family metallopeptidase [Zavarzinia sp. CC-PAN008]|uniref:M67 family metallopeptidase n=1 Tax=Zavarzinia sp. CC-PAN008 TaxID=3243332 RepID=UPI003F749B1C